MNTTQATTTAQDVKPLRFEAPKESDECEEAARAELYGLLAALFYMPPSRQLLATIASVPDDGDSVLQQAWSQLAAACAQTNAEQARQEYDNLFIGVGKPDLMLYGSYYLSGFLMEKPLAELRSDLAALGLERDDDMQESEDHIAALCEVMRYLIVSDDIAHANVATQKKFFAAHLQPWVGIMCEQIMQHPQARFYGSVAHLAKTFFDVEMQAFDMV